MPRHRAITLTLAFFAGLASVAGAPAGASQEQSHPDGAGRISVEDLKTLLAGRPPVLVIDVRGEVEEKIEGAVRIPVGDIEARLREIPRDREIVTYCA